MADDHDPTISRRRALAQLGVGGAVAWATPVILSSPARAAGSGCTLCDSDAIENGSAVTDLSGWVIGSPGPVRETALSTCDGTTTGFRAQATVGDSTSTMTQLIATDDCTFDPPTVTATLSACLRGATAALPASVRAEFLDSNSASLGSVTITRTGNSWAQQSGSTAVPAGTTQVLVTVSLGRAASQSRRAGATSISLSFSGCAN